MNGRQITASGARIQGPLLAVGAVFVSLSVGLAIVAQSFSVVAVVLGFCAVTCLAAFLARPEFIVPALIVTIPLEISKLYFPFWYVEKTLDGRPVSIVELWRVILVIGVVGFVIILLTAPKNRKSILVLKHPIVLSSVIFVAFCAFQAALVSPDRSRALVDTARLGAHVLLLTMTASLLSSLGRVELALKSFLYSTFALALLGIYQYFTGDFFWNMGLESWGGMNRVNTTFGDPNVFARYLAILVIFSLVLMTGAVMRTGILYLSLIAGLTALLFTFSRSGWLLVPVGFAIVWWYSRGKRRAMIMGWGLVVGALTATMFLSMAVLAWRGHTLSTGISALGDRIALINTGFHMFLAHPVAGVGFGSFGSVALTDFRAYLPYHARYVYLSHTALVTVLAELGTVGMALTFWIFGAVYKAFRNIRASGLEPYSTYALGLLVAIICIVLSGQSEGRMFEEPILWVFMGMLVALDRPVVTGKTLTGHEKSPGQDGAA